MNWGNKLLVTFLVFGGGMSFLVYRSMNTDFELVEKDYYKSELRYQEVIDNVRRANALSDIVHLDQAGKAIHLQLPPEMMNLDVTGFLYFYCAYDSKKDRRFAIKTDAGAQQSFEATQVPSGQYTAKINWKAGGKEYYTERLINIQ